MIRCIWVTAKLKLGGKEDPAQPKKKRLKRQRMSPRRTLASVSLPPLEFSTDYKRGHPQPGQEPEPLHQPLLQPLPLWVIDP